MRSPIVVIEGVMMGALQAHSLPDRELANACSLLAQRSDQGKPLMTEERADSLFLSVLRTRDGVEMSAAPPAQPAAPASATVVTSLSGKRIVLTGKLSIRRDVATNRALQAGAIVQNAVNDATELLVMGERSGSVKRREAEKRGITVISEAEFLALLCPRC